VEIEKSWVPTLLCIIKDSLKYNDSLRNSQTVTDIEDIEEWMMSIYEFKEYLTEELMKDKNLYAEVESYLNE